MQELFAKVLKEKDLSKAGDLFSVEDKDIENDLSEVLQKIQGITDAPEYLTKDNDQSVVEICITRVTSAIRETGSIEKHAKSLVSLLESCLKHNLKPSGKEEDPPHAKIASDIMSCIFLNYSKKPVMEIALPVAVKFLHQGNKELSRNLSSYLSLAAIDNAKLLAKHTQPILQSIVTGNRSLARVLPQIYRQNKEPINLNISALIQVLHVGEPAEKNSLLQLCGLVTKEKPRLLEKHIPQLNEHLASTATSPMVLQMFVDMAKCYPKPLIPYMTQLQLTAKQQPATLSLIAQIYGQIGRINKKLAKECASYLTSQLAEADNHCVPTILQEVYNIADAHPSVLPEHMPQIVPLGTSGTVATRVAVQQIREILNKSTSSLPEKKTTSSQTEGIVTVITLTDGNQQTNNNEKSNSDKRSSKAIVSNLPHSKNASTSTREINSSSFNIGGTSSGGSSVMTGGAVSGANVGTVGVLSSNRNHLLGPVAVSGVTVSSSSKTSNTTLLSNQTIKQYQRQQHHPTVVVSGSNINSSTLPMQQQPHSNLLVSSSTSTTLPHGVSIVHTGMNTSIPRHPSATIMTTASRHSSASHSLAERPGPVNTHAVPQTVIRTTIAGSKAHTLEGHGGERRQTVITTSSSAPHPPTHVNAIPFRDAVQQFCEKHLDKIKIYIEGLIGRLPIPIKATLEETKHKKHCKLHLICFGQDEECLYNDNFFTVRTKLSKTWIHIMFLGIQARSQKAVSQQDPAVGNLKVLWDKLKPDSGNSFVRLVTSSFPSTKDQDTLVNELHDKRYFDVFDFDKKEKIWACFMCINPEKVTGFLQDGLPNIEGQLKEKKGRWKIFKRWKTRYFTLSGNSITYNTKNKKASLPVTKIQSVKTIRKGARDIPKAFEIFTNDETYVFKAKDTKNAEQWIQCLNIAVVRTKNTKDQITDFDMQTLEGGLPAKMKDKKRDRLSKSARSSQTKL